MESPTNIDLHIPDNLLDIHLLKKQRIFFDRYIGSDVEYFARLHSINFVNYHVDVLSNYLKDSIIIDIGCGQLPYINAFSGFGIRSYYAVDLDLASLKLGHKNFHGDFFLMMIQHSERNTPFNENSADIVISSEVIEHMEEPKVYLNELYRICKKGGVLSLSTPCASIYYYPHNFLNILRNPFNRSSWLQWFKHRNAHKFWKEAVVWHPALRPRVIGEWLKNTGFKIIQHKTRLWFYHTPIRPAWRFFDFLEKKGTMRAGKMFYKYLCLMERMLSFNIPILKWAGIRQFIFCKKE